MGAQPSDAEACGCGPPLTAGSVTCSDTRCGSCHGSSTRYGASDTANWDSESEDDSAEADFRVRTARVETDELEGMVSMQSALGVGNPHCGLFGLSILSSPLALDVGQQRFRAEESFLMSAQSRRLPAGPARQKRRQERSGTVALPDGGLLTPPAPRLLTPPASGLLTPPAPDGPVGYKIQLLQENSFNTRAHTFSNALTVERPRKVPVLSNPSSVVFPRASSCVVIKAATFVRDATVTTSQRPLVANPTKELVKCIPEAVPPSIEKLDPCVDLDLPTVCEGLEATGMSPFFDKPCSAIDGRRSAPPRVGTLPDCPASVQPRSPSVQPHSPSFLGASLAEGKQSLPFAVSRG